MPKKNFAFEATPRGRKYALTKEGVAGKYRTKTQRLNRVKQLDERIIGNRWSIRQIERRIAEQEGEQAILQELLKST